MTAVTYQELQKDLSKFSDEAAVRLVYVSKISRHYKSDPKLFEHIEQHASVYNQKNSINGFLCNDNTYFLQCLEGSKKALLPLMSNIFKDKRHYDVRVILNESIPHHEFSNWKMRSLYLDEEYWSTNCQYPNCIEFNTFLPLRPLDWELWYIEQFIQLMKSFEISDQGEYELQYNTLSYKESKLVKYLESFTLLGLIIVLIVIMSLMLISKYT